MLRCKRLLNFGTCCEDDEKGEFRGIVREIHPKVTKILRKTYNRSRPMVLFFFCFFRFKVGQNCPSVSRDQHVTATSYVFDSVQTFVWAFNCFHYNVSIHKNALTNENTEIYVLALFTTDDCSCVCRYNMNDWCMNFKQTRFYLFFHYGFFF